MSIADNVRVIRETIAALAPGRQVTILAATKGRTAEAINSLLPLGIYDIGENRVQEWQGKRDGLDGRLRYHHIGQMQANKLKYIIGSVRMIQSADRPTLLKQIARLSLAAGTTTDVLLQVNTAREPQKAGVLPEGFPALYEQALAEPGLRVRGIMCMAPLSGGGDAAKRAFSAARELFDRHAGGAFDTLSMGMSHDYEAALACGATMLRLGSAIFDEQHTGR